jgi:CRISPR-associated protein Csb1
MDIEQLLSAVQTGSVIRLGVDLAPLNNDGLVCPPTYAAARVGDPPHIAFRKAFVNGEQRDVVVLDSPQSQSNRIEQALLTAARAGRISYPDIEIRFPSLPQEPVYSVLQLSHRIYDAVMRAANMADGTPFYESDIGRAIQSCRLSDATALFTHAPVTLVLGAWDSNGGGGPLSAKIPRLLTSEIIGLDAQPAALSATKFDPMDVRSQVAELLPTQQPVQRFTIKSGGSKDKGKKPSEFGFGSVPATAVPRAAVISAASQTSVLSCSGLRQINFGPLHDAASEARNQAGRAAIAALALYGLFAQNESGYRLRSRCELIPRDAGRLEVIGRTLKDIEVAQLDSNSALTLLTDALHHAHEHGLVFRPQTLQLTADDRLTELVRRSREAVAHGTAQDE